MRPIRYSMLIAVSRLLAINVHGTPVSVAGDEFVLVATRPSGPQLACLTADQQGRIYVGNNSNGSGIPIQIFNPKAFMGTPIQFQAFGPKCDDADGMVYGNGSIYVSDSNVGVRKISVDDETATIFNAVAGRSGYGSPLAFRPSDGHIFAADGGIGAGPHRIGEFDASGVFIKNHSTATEVETLAIDPVSELLYYAPFGATVRSLDPVTGNDVLVGMVGGTIDAGLAFDPLSQRLFVGTANGANQGRVYTINVTNGAVALFATGFEGCLGILREQLSGDLFFLESHSLYRLSSTNVVQGLIPKLFVWPSVELGWISDSNKWYQVQWSSEVDTNTWFDFGGPVRGTGFTNFVFDTTRDRPKRFYRVFPMP